MTAPVAPTTVAKLGPGTLTIGATGTLIDCSCLLNGARITASKDKEDDTTKLCGTKRTGRITYTYELTGNIDIDIAAESGIFALSQTSPGSAQPYKFTPNTAAGVTATGSLVIDPLDFGGDAFGDDLTSDFTFSLTDKPVYTWPAAPLDEVDQPVALSA